MVLLFICTELYKRFVDETIRVKRSKRQYYLAREERERLEAKK